MAAAGWYPDPWRRYEYRYWDGYAWTPQVSHQGRQFVDAPAQAGGGESSTVRRVIWNVYALPMTLLILGSIAPAFSDLGPIAILDAVLSLPSLIALHLHIWDKRMLPSLVWRIYAFVYLAWQLAFSFAIEPAIKHTAFNPNSVITLALIAPLVVALFRYAFRKWER